MKKFRHRIEFIATKILFAAFHALPLDTASFIGGLMARSIGPFLRAHRIAASNLAMVFPQMTRQEKQQTLRDMWDNLGRVAAELSHLSGTELYDRMTVNGMENIPPIGKPAIFFSGHLGNWELSYPIAQQNGFPITLIYRQANNMLVDKLICDIRGTQASDMFPKGVKGSVKMLRAIKDGLSLAMLVDQKMNDGIAVPFFGLRAMTAPAIAELALRYDMPIIPARVVRTHGAHFQAHIYPPVVYEKTGDEERDVLAIMTQINLLLESWIREYPAQWFWVHKRWPNA